MTVEMRKGGGVEETGQVSKIEEAEKDDRFK
jgi:hypothetical protein